MRRVGGRAAMGWKAGSRWPLPCGRAWSACCPHGWRVFWLALALTRWAGCGLCQVGGPLDDKFAASGEGVNLFRLPMTPCEVEKPNGS